MENFGTFSVCEVVMSMHTEEDGVQAFVGQVLVDEQLFFSLGAAAKETDQVSMLQFGDQDGFVPELLCSLV